MMFNKLGKPVLVIVVFSLSVWLFVYYSLYDIVYTGARAPYVQMSTSNSIVIQWSTVNKQTGKIRYGKDKEHLNTFVHEQTPVNKHRLILTNLEPGSRYFYQTGSADHWEPFDPDKHWFYTHPEQNIPFRIWVIGDSGKAGKTLYQTRDSAMQWLRENPPFVSRNGTLQMPAINVWMVLGDIAYRSGTDSQFQSALFGPFENSLANTVLWPVIGNHDARRSAYFDVFSLPKNGESGGVASHTEHYYSFDYADAHFVMLDSESSDRSATGKMASWLQQDLARNHKTWLIAAFHHPPYTRGEHDSDAILGRDRRMREMRENILPILEQAGVDLVLSGHSHVYERSYLLDCAYAESSSFSAANIVSGGIHGKHQHYIKPQHNKAHQGAVYIVAGSTAKVDNGSLDHPAHVIALNEPGSVLIEIDKLQLTSRFINSEGEVRDYFTLRKKADYSSSYQGCL